MIRLLADENFNNNIVRGVRLRQPGIDLIRVQDVGLSVARDPALLEALYRQGGSAKDAALNGQVIPAEKLEELAANQAAASRSSGGVQSPPSTAGRSPGKATLSDLFLFWLTHAFGLFLASAPSL